MNRRKFLKGLIGAIVAGSTSGLLLQELFKNPKLIATESMVEPTKTSPTLNTIERKLLMVDELPQGPLARYERDVAVKSYVIPERGRVPKALFF